MPEAFRAFSSKVVPLRAENVDTDQVVPARYLKVTDKNGLAEALFRDWRFEEDGSLKEPPFVLDQPEMAGRKILLAGDNPGRQLARARRRSGVGQGTRPSVDVVRGHLHKATP
jgi:3-isopropylmalate dehydratase small subunit